MSSKVTIFIFPRVNEIKARHNRKGETQRYISHKFMGPQLRIADVAPQCQLYKLAMTNLSFYTCATGKISSAVGAIGAGDSTFPGVGIWYRCVLGPAWSFETSFPGGLVRERDVPPSAAHVHGARHWVLSCDSSRTTSYPPPLVNPDFAGDECCLGLPENGLDNEIG